MGVPYLYVPYLYVPSTEAAYVRLVTPWGSVQMNKGFLLQLAGSVAVLVFTLFLWRCAANLNETLKKKVGKDKGEAREGDSEGAEEEEREEKLIQKGENSYYYAHKGQDESAQKTQVSSYGWSDSKEAVSIFLTDKSVVNMTDEQLVLKWTKTSLSMNLLGASGSSTGKSLVISTLFQEIKDVTWKANKDTLTLTLLKAKPLPWNSLNGAAKKMEEHIEYDDSLYD